ncbi:MAG TPA: ribosome biogenesis GTPase Der [Syntrophales bacterium]|nr:ribosome biogenesis GTPase Der [Syntrophales bacterium]
MKPVIAIVGRPNVGKSTLFNRLAEKRKAIVIDEPGATRDRNYADGEWYGKPFLLIDTGGFEPASTEGILASMREQAMFAVEEADIVIFLLDGREGLLPADVEIAGMLRKIDKPVFFAVNKVDSPRHEALLSDFYRLGVDTLYAISAQTGIGLDELMDAATAGMPAAEAEPEEPERTRIAVIGKPNVGKSSLVNRILGFERSIVNPAPGTTRDPVDTPITIEGAHYLLVDTAGIRRKGRVSLTLEKYSVIQALKTIERCDIALMLIDAQEGVTEQDAKIAGLAFERGVAVIIVVNKWDLVEKDERTIGTYVLDIKNKMKFLDFAPIITVSALTGQRVLKVFREIEKVREQYVKRIETGELNRGVRQILEENPPPRLHGRPHNFLYVTQIGVKPPAFAWFVKDPKAVHFSYERFLVNRIRETFGFENVPIRIHFKKK